jgi:hypothetical protein
VPARTRIVVYNATATAFPQTISYLERRFDVEVSRATDDTVAADIVITIGQDTPALAAPG